MSHTSVIHTSAPGSRKKMSLLIVLLFLTALFTPSGWNRSKDRFVKWTELKGKVCFWNKWSLSSWGCHVNYIIVVILLYILLDVGTLNVWNVNARLIFEGNLKCQGEEKQPVWFNLFSTNGLQMKQFIKSIS